MIIEALSWQTATISEIRQEAPRTKTFRLTTNSHYEFIAGQHTILRVRLPSGFKSSRDYSFSSAPSSNVLEITVAKEPQGEVSSWLCDTCVVGDIVEITPPLGTDFTWTPAVTEPSLLIAGGVGVAPFMSMLRERSAVNIGGDIHLLYSAKTYDDICFKQELLDPAVATNVTISVSRPLGDQWKGLVGRITPQQLEPLVHEAKHVYVCGSYSFVTDIQKLLIDTLHFPESSLRLEKFN